MPSGVLVVVETRDGELRSVAAETASAGRKLADEMGATCSALIIGEGIADKAPRLGPYGVDKVYIADDPLLGTFSGTPWLRAVELAVESADPAIILLSATSIGNDLAPRIAATLGAGYAAACTEVGIDGGQVTASRPVYAGKIMQQVRLITPSSVVSIRPKSVPVDDSRGTEPTVVTLDTTPVSDVSAERGLPVEAGEGAKVELTEADRIVSGGRGMGDPGDWGILEEVAGELGAALGASRAAVDAGWRPHSEQVGQTGKTVTPGLYLACGISGAMQHLAGMNRSKVIVAINKDRDAPIFGVADYGIVGDVHEVLPRLAEELRAKYTVP